MQHEYFDRTTGETLAIVDVDEGDVKAAVEEVAHELRISERVVIRDVRHGETAMYCYGEGGERALQNARISLIDESQYRPPFGEERAGQVDLYEVNEYREDGTLAAIFKIHLSMADDYGCEIEMRTFPSASRTRLTGVEAADRLGRLLYLALSDPDLVEGALPGTFDVKEYWTNRSE